MAHPQLRIVERAAVRCAGALSIRSKHPTMGTTESIFADGEGHTVNAQQEEQGPPPRRRPSGAGRTRRASPPPSSPTRTELRLMGVILGRAKVGKRTLLQRLEGKDPFAECGATPRSRSETLVPYRAPGVAWDRIQLHVQTSRGSLEYADMALDFFVLLIDPRHDGNETERYLTETLHSILRLQ
jgi:hypothetical protein